jgi:hypothetical protein
LRESGISGNASAIGGIFNFFTNLQFWETAEQQKNTLKTKLG